MTNEQNTTYTNKATVVKFAQKTIGEAKGVMKHGIVNSIKDKSLRTTTLILLLVPVVFLLLALTFVGPSVEQRYYSNGRAYEDGLMSPSLDMKKPFGVAQALPAAFSDKEHTNLWFDISPDEIVMFSLKDNGDRKVFKTFDIDEAGVCLDDKGEVGHMGDNCFLFKFDEGRGAKYLAESASSGSLMFDDVKSVAKTGLVSKEEAQWIVLDYY